MQKQERGMTAIGIIMLLAVFGFIGFGVIQMVPVYLENMKVVKLLNQVKDELDGQNAGLVDIHRAIEKRIDIEYLNDMNWREDFEITRSPGGYEIFALYERQRALVANLSLLAEFEHEVEIIR